MTFSVWVSNSLPTLPWAGSFSTISRYGYASLQWKSIKIPCAMEGLSRGLNVDLLTKLTAPLFIPRTGNFAGHFALTRWHRNSLLRLLFCTFYLVRVHWPMNEINSIENWMQMNDDDGMTAWFLTNHFDFIGQFYGHLDGILMDWNLDVKCLAGTKMICMKEIFNPLPYFYARVLLCPSFSVLISGRVKYVACAA